VDQRENVEPVGLRLLRSLTPLWRPRKSERPCRGPAGDDAGTATGPLARTYRRPGTAAVGGTSTTSVPKSIIGNRTPIVLEIRSGRLDRPCRGRRDVLRREHQAGENLCITRRRRVGTPRVSHTVRRALTFGPTASPSHADPFHTVVHTFSPGEQRPLCLDKLFAIMTLTRGGGPQSTTLARPSKTTVVETSLPSSLTGKRRKAEAGSTFSDQRSVGLPRPFAAGRLSNSALSGHGGGVDGGTSFVGDRI
jgi:hypothetical protein